MKVVIMLLSALAFVASGCSQSTSEESRKPAKETTVAETGVYKTVNATEFENAMESGEVQVVDVRTPSECASGVIEGSENINIGDSDFEKQIETLDKEKPVLVYCASGIRSLRAMKILEKKGFSKVLDLKGGYGEWVNYQRN